jgi:hypothetical protein
MLLGRVGILLAFPLQGFAAQSSGEMSMHVTPGLIAPGEEIAVTVAASEKKSPTDRFYFSSDDHINCPVNAMIDNGALEVGKSGPWDTHGTAKTFYGGTFINCTEAGGALEIPFSGEFFRLYGFRAPNRGIVEIFLDGKSLGEVDTYAPKDEPSALLYARYGLKSADHVLRFVVTGKKSGQSTGDQISFDAMERGVAGTETKAHPMAEGIYEIQAMSTPDAPVAKACIRVGMNHPGAGRGGYLARDLAGNPADGRGHVWQVRPRDCQKQYRGRDGRPARGRVGPSLDEPRRHQVLWNRDSGL